MRAAGERLQTEFGGKINGFVIANTNFGYDIPEYYRRFVTSSKDGHKGFTRTVIAAFPDKGEDTRGFYDEVVQRITIALRDSIVTLYAENNHEHLRREHSFA